VGRVTWWPEFDEEDDEEGEEDIVVLVLIDWAVGIMHADYGHQSFDWLRFLNEES
jgi:hypothetical protein